MTRKRSRLNHEYLQSAIFGINDALVSTTGVIVGMSVGVHDKKVVILAGVVTILVESISMATGQYLSLKSAHEYNGKKGIRIPITSGLVMFLGYLLGGLVPLLPILILPLQLSRFIAILAAFVGLYVLGAFKGRLVNASPWRSALEMVLIGGVSTAVGILAGLWLEIN